jgi:hypothetical protein
MIAYGIHSKEINMWRSETLRILDPKENGAVPRAMKTMKQEIAAARHRSASVLTQALIDMVSPFLSQCNPYELLNKVVYPATELAFSLWTQRSYLSVKTMHDGLPRAFSNSSPYLEASSLHAAENEENLEGREILMVLFPALVMHGDSDGTDYSSVRILSPAVVWMGPEPEQLV